jgi:hypothetical protein
MPEQAIMTAEAGCGVGQESRTTDKKYEMTNDENIKQHCCDGHNLIELNDM